MSAPEMMKHSQFAFRNFKDKLVKCLRQPAFVPFYVNTYVVKPLQGRQPNICFVSYPKCGRTWIMYLFDKYYSGEGRPEYERDSNWFELPDGQMLKFEHEQGNWVPAPPPLEQLSFDAERYRDKKVIFLVRDPRDVLISSWYHLTYREPIYTGSKSQFIREDLVGVRKVVAFINMWLEHRDVPEDFMMLRYEELKEDPQAKLRQMLEFIGEDDLDDALVARAVEQSSFDKMKQAEKGRSSGSPWLNPGKRPTDKALKVRKGKVGGFRDELSEHDIRYLDDEIAAGLTDELSMYKYDSLAQSDG
jgi:hypothetical protein